MLELAQASAIGFGTRRWTGAGDEERTLATALDRGCSLVDVAGARPRARGDRGRPGAVPPARRRGRRRDHRRAGPARDRAAGPGGGVPAAAGPARRPGARPDPAADGGRGVGPRAGGRRPGRCRAGSDRRLRGLRAAGRPRRARLLRRAARHVPGGRGAAAASAGWTWPVRCAADHRLAVVQLPCWAVAGRGGPTTWCSRRTGRGCAPSARTRCRSGRAPGPRRWRPASSTCWTASTTSWWTRRTRSRCGRCRRCCRCDLRPIHVGDAVPSPCACALNGIG